MRTHREQPPSITVLNLLALQPCQFTICRVVTLLQPECEKTFCAFCIDIHVTLLLSKKLQGEVGRPQGYG